METETKGITEYLKLCKNLSIECFPNFLFFLCIMLLNTINLVFISLKYSNYMMIEAIGICNLYVTITTNVVTTGLITGIEILASNAYGDKDYYLMGVYIHRGRLISFIYLIIMSIVNYFFSGEILAILNVSPEILDLAKTYIFFSLIAIFFTLPFQINYRVLIIVGHSNINFLIIITATILHFLWCYLFILYYDLGIMGAGLVTVFTEFLCFISTQFYIHYYFPHKGAIFSINRDCFKGWGEYLKIALPTTLLVFGEWLGYEIQALFALRMSDIDYTAHLITIQIDMIVFSTIWAIGMIVTMRVAESIVKDHISKTLFIIKAAFLLIFINGIIAFVLVYFNREFIISLFTVEPRIIELTTKTLQIASFYFFWSGAFYCFNYAFRGISYIKVPTILSLINFYIVQTSLTLLLGFYFDLGVIGIWISNLIGSFLMTFIDFIIFLRLDLKEYQEITLNRLNNDKMLNEKKNN